MKVKHILVIFLSLLNIYSTCKPRICTPPARTWPDETPGSLEKGKNALRMTGGAHLHPEGWLSYLNYRAGSWTFSWHRGFTDHLEAGVQTSLLAINDDGRDVDTKPYVFTIRIASKLSPEPVKRLLGLRSGLGLGFSDAGEFFSVDGGLVLGFDNPYIVPFLNPGIYISFPFNTETIDFGLDDPTDPMTAGYADDPEITWGFESGAGFKLYPLGFSKKRDIRKLFAIYVISSATQCAALYHDDDEWFFSFGGGIEFIF